MFVAPMRHSLFPAALLCGLVLIGGNVTCFAREAIPVSSGQVQLHINGLTGQGGAVNLSLVKMGTLGPASENSLGDGSVCPAGQRLEHTGMTVVCQDPDGALGEWYKKTLAGTTDRKSGSVIYLDRAGSEVLRTYTWNECFPISYKKYEPDDCDDSNIDQVQLEIRIEGIVLVPRKSKASGDYVPAHNFKLEIDRCIPGVPCSGPAIDIVHEATLCVDAATVLPGEAGAWLKSATTFAVLLNTGDDDCDDLCQLVLQSQGKPETLPTLRATVNTSRSNIKHSSKTVTASGPTTVLTFSNARIRSVTLPTFQVLKNPPAAASDTHIVEEIEFVVEKVERA
jgi:hypothetical protein